MSLESPAKARTNVIDGAMIDAGKEAKEIVPAAFGLSYGKEWRDGA